VGARAPVGRRPFPGRSGWTAGRGRLFAPSPRSPPVHSRARRRRRPRRPRSRPRHAPPSDSSYAASVTKTAGLAAYWRLDETSGATACDVTGWAGGEYPGDVQEGIAGALTGDSDTAIGLAGDGYVAVPSTSALSPTASLTLEAWVRPSSVSTSQTVWQRTGSTCSVSPGIECDSGSGAGARTGT
jgi:hypothetical protein